MLRCDTIRLVWQAQGERAMARGAVKTIGVKAEKIVRRRVPKWALQSGETGDAASDEQYYLRSIGRALEVLNCFDGQMPLSLKEIGMRTELPESTLFRVLLTLEKHEYLQQSRDGTYQLAPKLIFGWLAQAANRVRDLARPEIQHLASQFNETVSLAYLYEDRIHVLDCMETFHDIRIANKIGRVLPPHCSAMGKSIAAFQDRERADRILEVYGLAPRTERTIVDRRRLFQEFEEIRRSGIACDREESIQGGICFGAALRTEGKPVVAAISVSTPTMRMTGEREHEIQAAILAAAGKIGSLL
jgi:DNA-binding IclR family transcriptional regulator